MKKNLKSISLYVDIIFCAVILPLILLLVPVEKWIVSKPDFLIILTVYLYFVYFVHRKSNIPGLVMKKKYKEIAAVALLLTGVTWALGNYPIPESEYSRLTYAFREHLRSQTVWFFFLTVSGFSLAIELVFELFRQILQKQQLESEKNKAELALYKSQIDPHFLFNTLNSIYALVVSKSDKAEEAFIRFSGILKYIYSNRKDDTAGIGTETDCIRQYIGLQEMRLNSHTSVEFRCDIGNRSLEVPSMMLLTFVENAFKYGVSPEEDCHILLDIRSDDHSLTFLSENCIMDRRPRSESNVGISNCRKRLELLYPDRHRLTVTDDGRIFRVILEIWDI